MPGRLAAGRRTYEIEIHDRGMVHHERMYDASGDLIYEQGVPMDYVVGSGRRAKAYLHRRGDLLLMSPLNWYTQAEHWDLAPGYSDEDPRRFDRRVTDECLGCHAGRVAARGRSLNRYHSPAFHEMSIGCENCHGPGADHIAMHESGALADAMSDPIVNPARLDHAGRESVCYQCHLQAAARVPRYGRSHLDFRPGDKLEEIWTVLEAGSGLSEDGRTRAVSHVQQMRESRCYQESDGRLGCTSCHDPHRLPDENERVAFYRNRCLACHDDQSCELPREHRTERDNSCIACHMPGRDASNISHVTQTDHRVIRTVDAGSDEELDGGSETLSFFAGSHRRLEGWERDRALGIGAWLHLSKTGRPFPPELARRLDRVLETVPDDGAVLTVLGATALDHGRLELARRYYSRALAVPDAEEAALSGLLKIHYLSADWPQALDYAERLLRIDPGNASAHSMRADSLKMLGRTDEAIDAALRALEFNPTLVPVRSWLVDLSRAAGRSEERREQEDILLRMRETQAE